MPNYKKFISNTLRSLADYVDKGTCNASEWEAMRQGIIENLELNRQGITDEQYLEIKHNLDSIKSTMGYLYLKIDALEKSEDADVTTAHIVNLNPKQHVQ